MPIQACDRSCLDLCTILQIKVWNSVIIIPKTDVKKRTSSRKRTREILEESIEISFRREKKKGVLVTASKETNRRVRREINGSRNDVRLRHPKDSPLTSRPMNFTKLIGAHVSTMGGVHHSIAHAQHIGGTAFALFLRSQRRWESPALNQAHVELFKERAVEHGYGAHTVLPHGSYLVNLGNPDKTKREKSYVAFLDELRRCEQLGLKLYNFQ